MKLIIPDIHEDWRTARKILEQYPDHEKVFLGDFFDSFTRSESSTRNTFELLHDLASDPKNTLLWGNHDIHYAWPDVDGIHCSGFNGDTLRMIDGRLLGSNRFKLSVVAEGFVLSHAGWTWLPPMQTQKYIDGMWQDALDLVESGTLPAIFKPGWRRGGERGAYGGPVWLDWRDFKPIPGIRQIVGHTPEDNPRWLDGNLCLDTNMGRIQHVALIDNGAVEIVPV